MEERKVPVGVTEFLTPIYHLHISAIHWSGGHSAEKLNDILFIEFDQSENYNYLATFITNLSSASSSTTVNS
jgi:hypothetical protein